MPSNPSCPGNKRKTAAPRHGMGRMVLVNLCLSGRMIHDTLHAAVSRVSLPPCPRLQHKIACGWPLHSGLSH